MKDIIVTKRITPYTQLRKARNWSQEFVAEHLGIHWRTLGNYEAGLRDAPKWVVVALDELYEAHGELIKYWLEEKYSISLSNTWKRVSLAYKKAKEKIRMSWRSHGFKV